MISMLRRLVLLLPALIAPTLPAAAASEPSGLPVPRFVSLRSAEVNWRTGPGVRYPVNWVYSRKDMPVEIIAEFEAWRKIRDWQGTEGWVHQSMLSGRRHIVVTGANRKLRRDGEDGAAVTALVEPGVVGRLLQCPRTKVMCKVEVDGTQGWLKREEFWGVYPAEYLD